MINFTDKEYKERVEKLPERLKELVESFDLLDFIGKVYDDYNLSFEKKRTNVI